jgi:putative DNA primase/helicase
MHVDEVLAYFPDAKRSGTGWTVRCPAHDDRTPSLTISTGNGGRTLLKCHAGCRTEDVLSELGLSFRDLYPTPETVTTPTLRSSPSMPTTYDYRDVDGTLLHQVVRGVDKSFRQRSPGSGSNEWVWKASGWRVPYRWPDLVDQSTVWIVEGEKDVETCWSRGLPATCNLGGAGKWTADETQALVDLKTVTQVYVVPHHDTSGYKHARTVEAEMQRVNIPVTIVPLPNLREKGDISDWFDDGGTVPQLQALAASPAPLPDNPPVPDNRPDTLHLTRASDITPKAVSWLWEGRLPLGAISLLAGREGQGKSLWSYQLAADLTRGDTPGHFFGTPKSVIVVATEDSWEHTITPRLLAARADCTRVFQVAPPPCFPHDLDALARLIDAKDVALLILDPLLSRLDPKMSTNIDVEVRRSLEPLAAWAETLDIAILGLIHPNKNTTGDVLTSLTGSRALPAVARAILVLIADPDDPTKRLLGQVKNNLGITDQPTLAFTIGGASIEGEITIAKIMWLPDDPRSIFDCWEQVKAAGRATPGSAPTKVAEAAEWVKKYLTAHGGEAPVADLLTAGALNDYSRCLLNDAKVKLDLDHPKRGTWSLPTVALVGAPQVPTSPTSPTSLEAPPSNAVSTQTKETKQ